MFYRENLRKIRKEKKMSQQKLGSLLGRTHQAVYRWEAGTRTPTVSDIYLMAQLLDISVKELSDLNEIDFSSLNTGVPSNLQSSVSFVDKIEGSISIQDRIFLNGINAELQTLRDKVHKFEQESSSPETIANELNSFIYKKDLDGKFTYINKSYAKYLNVENNIILGKTNAEIFGWKETQSLGEIEAEAIKTPYINNRLIVIPGSRRKKHGLLSTSSIYKKSGLLKEILVKIEDVTNELETIDRYKTLENVIHSSNEILWIKTNDGNYTFVGAPIHSISGYPVNEFTNNPRSWLTNVVDEYDREKVGEFYNTYESGDTIDYKIKTKNNKTKYVKEKIFRQNKLYFGIIKDVTSELKAQEDKQLLLDIIDKMPEPIAVIKNFGKEFAVCSSSMQSMLETSETNLQNMYHKELTEIIHVDDRDKAIKHREYLDSDKWWKSETKKSMQAELKYRIVLKNGKTRWIRSSTYSTLELKKQGIRFGILRDITKEQEQQLEMQYLFQCVNDMDSMFWTAECIDEEKNKFKYNTISRGIEKIFDRTKSGFKKDAAIWAKRFNRDNIQSEDKTSFEVDYVLHKGDTKNEKWIHEIIHRKDNMLFGLTTDIARSSFMDKGNKKLLDKAIDEISSGIVLLSADKKECFYANNSAAKIFEVKQSDFAKPSVGKQIFGSLKDKKENIKDDNERERHYITKYPVNGKNKWLEIAEKPFLSYETKCTLIMAKDITQKKELESLQKLILQSFKEFNIGFSIEHLVTKQMVFDNANAGSDFLFGIPKNIKLSEIVNYWLNNIVHADDREEQIKIEKSGKLIPCRAYRIIHPKKGLRWIEVRRTKVIFKGEDYVVSFMSDITGRKTSQ